MSQLLTYVQMIIYPVQWEQFYVNDKIIQDGINNFSLCG